MPRAHRSTVHRVKRGADGRRFLDTDTQSSRAGNVLGFRTPMCGTISFDEDDDAALNDADVQSEFFGPVGIREMSDLLKWRGEWGSEKR